MQRAYPYADQSCTQGTCAQAETRNTAKHQMLCACYQEFATAVASDTLKNRFRCVLKSNQSTLVACELLSVALTAQAVTLVTSSNPAPHENRKMFSPLQHTINMLSYLSRESLQLRAKPPVGHIHRHQLVRRHHRLTDALPPLGKRPSARPLALELREILAGVVLLLRVHHHVDALHTPLTQRLGAQVQCLQGQAEQASGCTHGQVSRQAGK